MARVMVHVGDLPDWLVAQYVESGRVAWDIETSGLDWARDRIGTCQVGADGSVSIVQIEQGVVPRNLGRLLESPGVVKVFHHAAFDLRFMAHQWSVLPSNIQCTKVAAKILWPQAPQESHRLQALVQQELRRHLSKAEQRSNWLAGSLSDEQLKYAADDVVYLVPLIDQLLRRAKASGVLPLIEGSFAYLPTRVQLDILGSGDVFTY